ncbi:MAG: hypothetical protein EOO24_23015 [Comamonadaceae bacterium]|nr:MAG: hypothetical protein EOO24_23015 [Comamonadaceae bacterium]
MFLRAGVLSLALLLASRLLGVVRESALAAAFGSGGLADVAVLMLTLPDWVASVMASGALAYVLLPAWSQQQPGQVSALQRRVAVWGTARALQSSPCPQPCWRPCGRPGCNTNVTSSACTAPTWWST